MFGLVVLFFVGLFFLILILGTYFAYRIFKNRSRKLGITVFLAIFLPVFWDWIPTVIAYDYYCKQAGFTEFKPVEQWKKENPGVWETLRHFPSYKEKDEFLDISGKKYMDYQGERYEREPINQRISEYHFGKRLSPLLVFTGTLLIYDEEKKEVLAMKKATRAGPGNTLALGSRYGWSGFKLWLNKDTCDGGSNGGNGSAYWDYSVYRDAMSNPALEPNKTRK